VLDIRLVRENPHLIRKDLAKRGAAERAKLLEDVIRKGLSTIPYSHEDRSEGDWIALSRF